MEEQKLCKLCKINPADKKGSHVLSHFIIRDTINQTGQRKRDREVSFGIGETGIDHPFFGRSVPVEEIRRVIGRDLSDHEIDITANPYTVDFFLCSRCESKLGVLEAYCSENVYRLLEEHLNFEQKTLQLSLEMSNAFALLMYSFFWRCSATRFNGFALKKSVEEDLRYKLDLYLNDTRAGLLSSLSNALTYVNEYKLVCLFLQTPNEDKTNNLIKAEKNANAYNLYMGQLVCQLYEKGSINDIEKNWAFGLCDIAKESVLPYPNLDNRNILLVNNESRLDYLNNQFNYVIRRIKRKIVYKYRKTTQMVFGVLPGTREIDVLLKMLATDKVSKSYRFSNEHVLGAFARMLKYKSHYHIPRAGFLATINNIRR